MRFFSFESMRALLLPKFNALRPAILICDRKKK